MKKLTILILVISSLIACSKEDESNQVPVSKSSSVSSSGDAGGESDSKNSQGSEVQATQSYAEKYNQKFQGQEVFEGPQLQASFMVSKGNKQREEMYPGFIGESSLNACQILTMQKTTGNEYSIALNLGDDERIQLRGEIDQQTHSAIDLFTSREWYVGDEKLNLDSSAFNLNISIGNSKYYANTNCSLKLRPVALDFHYNNGYRNEYLLQGFHFAVNCDAYEFSIGNTSHLVEEANIDYYCSISNTLQTY